MSSIDRGSLRLEGRGAYFASLLAVALLYFVAAKLGFLFAFGTKQVTAVWPPTGIAFVAYVLLGTRAWPGVYLGALLVNATAGEPLAAAAGIAIGNTLAGIVGLTLARRFRGFRASLARVSDVLGLAIFGAAVGSVVSATGGVACLALAGIVPWSAYASVWEVWWVGDSLGVLVFAPLLLAWISQPFGLRGRRLVEWATLFAGLALASWVVFGGNDPVRAPPYMAFVFLLWAGLRFGTRETETAAVLLSGFAIWGVVHDRGPFATGTTDARLIQVDAFVAVSTMIAMLLGAVTMERQAVLDGLEHRVQERTADLERANDALASKNAEVESFVYIVSHDLRAPLVNLQGFSKELAASCEQLSAKLAPVALPPGVDVAVRSALEEEIPSSLRFIGASTTKFQRLIDALLVLSRYGHQPYRADPVDVRAVVEATVDSLRQSIETRGARVVLEPLPAATGDATAIGQIFSNLLVNALHYLEPARPGVIVIGGALEGAAAHYFVRDNGVGIPAEVQPRLFQVFQRFHPDRAPGEGMGLAIVKRVVERQEGKVWAESRVGEGTTFHFTLPAAPRAATAERA